jgi:hypothetical protein
MAFAAEPRTILVNYDKKGSQTVKDVSRNYKKGLEGKKHIRMYSGKVAQDTAGVFAAGTPVQTVVKYRQMKKGKNVMQNAAVSTVIGEPICYYNYDCPTELANTSATSPRLTFSHTAEAAPASRSGYKGTAIAMPSSNAVYNPVTGGGGIPALGPVVIKSDGKTASCSEWTYPVLNAA